MVNAVHTHPCHAGCPKNGNARPDARPKAGMATRTDRPNDEIGAHRLNPQLIIEVTALQSGTFLLDAATLWCTGRAVGLNVDVGSTFMSFIFASVVATLSPIPLGLGSFEGTCTGLLLRLLNCCLEEPPCFTAYVPSARPNPGQRRTSQTSLRRR